MATSGDIPMATREDFFMATDMDRDGPVSRTTTPASPDEIPDCKCAFMVMIRCSSAGP